LNNPITLHVFPLDAYFIYQILPTKISISDYLSRKLSYQILDVVVQLSVTISGSAD